MEKEVRDKQLADVRDKATRTGLIGFAQGMAISLPTVFILNKYYLPFKKLSVSAKSALVITLPILGFAFSADNRVYKLARPGLYEEEVERKDEHLAYWKQFANHLHDHPVQVALMIGVPSVAAIFVTRTGDHLKLSHRLMHTRVMGQFTMISLLFTTLVAAKYMDERGPYTS